jgi:hypothetical protein
MVFLSSSCRETAKKTIKKSEGKKSSNVLQNMFDMGFSHNVSHGVFELPLLENAQKRHYFTFLITKIAPPPGACQCVFWKRVPQRP